MLSIPARTVRLSPVLPREWPHLLALAGALVTVVAGLRSAHAETLLFELAAAAVFIALCIRWLLAGTLVFVVLTFPAQLPGSIGSGATLSKPLGVVLAFAWLFALLRDRWRAFVFRDRPLLGGLVIAYFTWAFVSLLWSNSTGNAVYDLKRLALAILLLVVLFSVAARRRDFLILMGGYVGASALTSVYVLASGVTIAGGRATGGVNDPNYLASELVLAIIGGGYLLGTTSRRSLRLLIVAAVTLDAAVFVLTQSRGGIVGMAVGTLVAIVIAGRTRATVLGLVALAAALAIGYIALVAPAKLQHRVTDFSSQSSSGRTDSWQIAWKIAKAHPLHGVAIGGYRNEQLKYAASSVDIQHIRYILDNQLVVHNTYLETLAELGVVGFVLLVGAMAICILGGWRAIGLAVEAGDHALANALRGLVAGSCGLFTAYIFVSAEYEKQLWFALALLGVSTLVSERRPLRAAAAAERRPRRGRLRSVPAPSGPA